MNLGKLLSAGALVLVTSVPAFGSAVIDMNGGMPVQCGASGAISSAGVYAITNASGTSAAAGLESVDSHGSYVGCAGSHDR